MWGSRATAGGDEMDAQDESTLALILAGLLFLLWIALTIALWRTVSLALVAG